MTEAPQVEELVTARTTEETTEAVDSFPFRLARDTDDTPEGQPSDPRVFLARKPKMAIMLKLGRMVDGVDLETITLGDMTGVFDDLLRAICAPDDKAYIDAKMEDPESDWDLDMLVPLLEKVREKWWPDRPTGRSAGSRGPQRKSGKRSTVRSRSRG
jgi:hypothetical protein